MNTATKNFAKSGLIQKMEDLLLRRCEKMLNYKFKEKITGNDLGDILYAINVAIDEKINTDNIERLKKLYNKINKCSLLYELELQQF